MADTVPQTSAADLVHLLKSKSKVVVLDVREQDELAAGTINGSVNVSSKAITSAEDTSGVDKAIAEVDAHKAEQVVVHCMLCQRRGPNSAKAIAERLEQLGRTDLKVTFLTNGICGFMDEIKDKEADKDLVTLPAGGWVPPDH